MRLVVDQDLRAAVAADVDHASDSLRYSIISTNSIRSSASCIIISIYIISHSQPLGCYRGTIVIGNKLRPYGSPETSFWLIILFAGVKAPMGFLMNPAIGRSSPPSAEVLRTLTGLNGTTLLRRTAPTRGWCRMGATILLGRLRT